MSGMEFIPPKEHLPENQEEHLEESKQRSDGLFHNVMIQYEMLRVKMSRRIE